MTLNYWAILVCTVLSLVIGAVWYGPLFGRKWMEVIGVKPGDEEARLRMREGVWKLYLTQFVLTLFQVWILAYFVGAGGGKLSLEAAIWTWAAIVMPIVAGNAMWNNDSADISWTRFLIQAGYQLVMFVIFGSILGYWK
ncbi:MAG: DUF1761 domain-containing protein [Candidatus Liptonbacteria bacterium]